LIRLRQRLEIFIADIVFIHVCNVEISSFYIFSFGPHDPYENSFLWKSGCFEMAISQEMASSESGHMGAESTLCGLQTHAKINVGSA
jgi:hypothetical protein